MAGLTTRSVTLLSTLVVAAAAAASAHAGGPVFSVVPEAAPVSDVVPQAVATTVAPPPVAAPAGSDPELVEQLNRFLAEQGAPLAGWGHAFVSSGRAHGLDPRYLVALSGAESSFGQFLFRPFNPFGWGSYDFTSWDEAIETVARGLEVGYLSEGLTDVFSISAKYAPVGASNDPNGTNGEHPHNISRFLELLGGDPGDVRGSSSGDGAISFTLFPASAPAATTWSRPLGEQAASLALEYVGVPYVWGGESPEGFDCSGLTKYVYATLGVELSHWTGDQIHEGTAVGLDALQPGDLVFFDLEGAVPAHMGLYIGSGLMVHAPHSGDVVRVVPLDDRYRSRFAGAARPA